MTKSSRSRARPGRYRPSALRDHVPPAGPQQGPGCYRPGPCPRPACFSAARAAETLAALLLVVVTCALTLIPQVTRLLGAEVLVVAGPALAATVRAQLAYRFKQPDQPIVGAVYNAWVLLVEILR
jgi:hypothetical protein